MPIEIIKYSPEKFVATCEFCATKVRYEIVDLTGGGGLECPCCKQGIRHHGNNQASGLDLSCPPAKDCDCPSAKPEPPEKPCFESSAPKPTCVPVYVPVPVYYPVPYYVIPVYYPDPYYVPRCWW